MFKILEKRKLSEASATWYMKVEAPEIARNRKAGQFIILQVDAEFGERIPLTIADANAEEGWIALAFQAVGATSYKLSLKNVGDELAALLGPLGNPSVIEKKDGPVVVVGGGFGVAPCYPIVQAHKAIGNKVIVVIAARTKDLLIYVDEMKAIADEVIIMTDDGSAGRFDSSCKRNVRKSDSAGGSYCNRTSDYDEILRAYNKTLQRSNNSFFEYNYD